MDPNTSPARVPKSNRLEVPMRGNRTRHRLQRRACLSSPATRPRWFPVLSLGLGLALGLAAALGAAQPAAASVAKRVLAESFTATW
jgi:hypothetical protein